MALLLLIFKEIYGFQQFDETIDTFLTLSQSMTLVKRNKMKMYE